MTTNDTHATRDDDTLATLDRALDIMIDVQHPKIKLSMCIDDVSFEGVLQLLLEGNARVCRVPLTSPSQLHRILTRIFTRVYAAKCASIEDTIRTKLQSIESLKDELAELNQARRKWDKERPVFTASIDEFLVLLRLGIAKQYECFWSTCDGTPITAQPIDTTSTVVDNPTGAQWVMCRRIDNS